MEARMGTGTVRKMESPVTIYYQRATERYYIILCYTVLYFIVLYCQEYRVPELLIAGINHRYYIILSPKKFHAKLHTHV
jgi:hypothetical protein